MPGDQAQLDRLFERCFAADSHWPLGEHDYLDLVAGVQGQSTGLVFGRNGEILAYAHLTDNGGELFHLGLAVDPLHRSEGLITTMIEDALEEAERKGARNIRFWVFRPAIAGILHHHGFHPERELRQLRCDLPNEAPGSLPEGVALKPFVVGQDETAWLDVNNRAFAGHPENGSWTGEILADRQRQSWFDEEGFLMAWEGSTLLGFCWTKVHPDSVGEIYVIAVDPAHQGRGLGRYLALAGLDHLHRRRGCSMGMLYVDAANHGALGLYEKLGFWMDHIDRSFVASVGAAG